MLDILAMLCKQGVRGPSPLSSTRQNTRGKITSQAGRAPHVPDPLPPETLAGQLHLTEEDLKATIPSGTCRPQEGSDRIGQRIRYLAWNSG